MQYVQPDIPAKNCFVCSLDVHSLYLRDSLSYELVGWWQQVQWGRGSAYKADNLRLDTKRFQAEFAQLL